MVQRLKHIIENKLVSDIYLKLPGTNECVLTYKAFRVTNIRTKDNIFQGYREENIRTPFEKMMLTEDNIGLICRIELQ